MDVTIKEIEYQRFHREIEAIADDVFGKGYCDNLLDDTHQWIVLGAFYQYELVGFFILKIVNDDHLLLIDSPEIIEKGGMVLNTIAVSPKWQRNGIGTKLLIDSVQRAVKEYIRYCYFVSWSHDGVIPMNHTLLRMGFKVIQEIEHYWHDDSLAKKYNCIKCGAPPCLCNAVIFQLKTENANV